MTAVHVEASIHVSMKTDVWSIQWYKPPEVVPTVGWLNAHPVYA